MEPINAHPHLRTLLPRTSKANAAVRSKTMAKEGRSRQAFGEISNKQSQPRGLNNQKALGKKAFGFKEESTTTSKGEKFQEQDLCSQFEECNFEDGGLDNIDKEDSENPQLCSNYVNAIYQYMLLLEHKFPIRKDYLAETSLKPKVRSILVDWLMQVHHRFGMLQETLYLTVAVLDRYLQDHPVPKSDLQLVGVTAMHVAAKYEEMYAAELNDYVYVSDDSFTREQVMAMEIKVLNGVGFNFGRPHSLHFLRRNSKAGNVEPKQHFMAKYLLELAMVDYNMCHVKPSKVAAAALYLSLRITGGDWTKTLAHYSTYKKEDILPVVCHLAKNLLNAPHNVYARFTREKYAHNKLLKISKSRVLENNPIIENLANRAEDAEL